MKSKFGYWNCWIQTFDIYTNNKPLKCKRIASIFANNKKKTKVVVDEQFMKIKFEQTEIVRRFFVYCEREIYNFADSNRMNWKWRMAKVVFWCWNNGTVRQKSTTKRLNKQNNTEAKKIYSIVSTRGWNYNRMKRNARKIK